MWILNFCQEYIFSVILILVFLKIIRDSLFFVWLWQIKEYRIDRMKAYLRDRNVGSIVSAELWSPSALLIILFLILILLFKPVLLIYLLLLTFAYTFYQMLREIKSRTLKRPVLTFRVALTFLTITVFYTIIAFSWIPASTGMTSPADSLMFLLFAYLFTPILIAIIILFTNPFFNFQKQRIIKKATVKMRSLKKVKVIGITGSYGKTSTKEFLNTILSEKFKVVKTEGNNNTNIGVARTVLNKASDEYDYFICEMGAYKIGEIAEMCRIVRPEIGILTGINEQHLDLFGSIENTKKAKFELIESLSENGIAVINSGIKNQELRIKNINIKHFSLDSASNIKVCQDCVEFDYLKVKTEELNHGIASSLCGAPRNDSNTIKFKINLLGKHYVENILSAIITAESLGMNLGEISRAVEKIKSSKFMMRKLDGFNGSIFIDDSYSANPDGVIAALDYLDEAYRDYKKIIVFPGIIELGSSSEKVHQRLFGRINEVCDVAYVMSRKFIKLKVYKVDEESKCKFIFEDGFSRVADLLKNNLDKKTVVLFESRGAGVVMRKIKRY